MNREDILDILANVNESDNFINELADLILALEKTKDDKPKSVDPALLVKLQELDDLVCYCMKEWDGMDIAKMPKEAKGYREIFVMVNSIKENYAPSDDSYSDNDCLNQFMHCAACKYQEKAGFENPCNECCYAYGSAFIKKSHPKAKKRKNK